ncbi:MAG: ROK family protein [Acidobacteria bacterium]|nr:ROK family protein [Acidobacteriota bacterium]
MIRLGIDMGGTKIEGIALGRDGGVLARRRVPTPRGDYPGTVAAIADLVAGLEQEAGEPGTVGVGIPGTISPATGLIKNANSVWLIGRPFEQDLAARLGRRVRLANDANCFALSEASDGAGAGAAVVFGVIVGTGTGGGIVVHGRVVTGPNAVAGEWGHNPMPWPMPDEWPGPPCYCGRHGCIESFLSGPGLARDHECYTGECVSAETIVERARRSDAAAEATLQRYEERMARALSGVINLLDPDVIVLGGGVSKLERLYAHVPPLLGRWVFTDRVDTKVLPPKHGDASGVRGAAWLWPADDAAK